MWEDGKSKNVERMCDRVSIIKHAYASETEELVQISQSMGSNGSEQ